MKSKTARTSIICIAVACLPLGLALQTSTKCASSTGHHRRYPSQGSIHHSHLYSNASNKNEEPSKRQRKKKLEEIQKLRRRNRWIKRYGTVDALKQTFGTGPPWGDLSPTQTRALYHTLLPRTLLALNEMGLVQPKDLAPLAYEARIAAKEYARSRCIWTGRLGVFLFDQYRSLRDRGRLIRPGKSSSMSWEEIWTKYEKQIIQEYQEKGKELDEDELMMQTYMRILERSCSTNQTFDKLFLNRDSNGKDDSINLDSIAAQLERDVRAILLSPRDISKVEKRVNKLEKKQQKEQEKSRKVKMKFDKKLAKLKKKQ
jgi:hypothetical protein